MGLLCVLKTGNFTEARSEFISFIGLVLTAESYISDGDFMHDTNLKVSATMSNNGNHRIIMTGALSYLGCDLD